MPRRELRDPRGIVVGGLAGATAWALGVRPLAATALGIVVAGVEVLAALAVARPDGGGVVPAPSSEPSPAPASPQRPTSAGVPGAPGSGGGLFVREGEYWRVGMGEGVSMLRDAKGLRYLHVLLSNPGREFHALQLVPAADGSGTALPEGRGLPEGIRPGDGGEPLLDAPAKAAYRDRLKDLRLEVEEARAWNDDERAVRAEAEIEALAGELARAVGLGGRDRRTGAQAERARVNVTRAIRAAIDRIAEQDPSMAHHLSSTVHTGTFCSYAPDPLRPPTWNL